MISRHMERVPGYRSPVLPSDLLARIHALNSDYLELLATGSFASDDLDGNPCARSIGTQLRELSHDQRARLAAAPYALYSLRLDHSRCWRDPCSVMALVASERYRPSEVSAEALFCETVLLQAWHVANTSPLAARVVYAMTDAARTWLASAPLWLLKKLALEHSRVLTPRWPANPCFWPDLLRFAREDDRARLATTQLLGLQLVAVELESARETRAVEIGNRRQEHP
ncbi:MAG: hypothetical protein C0P74_002925 [Gammaproteobacteria bacterium]|nr:hypothetical protein [Gammaproteobacteria bacterium]